MNDILFQKDAKELGANGCYFSVIVKAAEKKTGKTFDLIRTYEYCTKQKFQGNPWIEKVSCFCWCPNKIMGYLLGKNVDVKIVYDIDYKPKTNEILIGCYEWYNPNTEKTQQHFCLVEKKKCIYDPIGESNTRLKGELKSYRVFTIYE